MLLIYIRLLVGTAGFEPTTSHRVKVPIYAQLIDGKMAYK